MELKYIYIFTRVRAIYARLNRTFMELKSLNSKNIV